MAEVAVPELGSLANLPIFGKTKKLVQIINSWQPREFCFPTTVQGETVATS